MGRMLVWLALGILGTAVPAAADSLTFRNCNESSFYIKTWNQNDTWCLIARDSRWIDSCTSYTFTCDGKCQVQAFGGVQGCASWPLMEGTYVIPKGTPRLDSLQRDTDLNRSRGEPDWHLICACTEAQMGF
jgi:hypothetical protein